MLSTNIKIYVLAIVTAVHIGTSYGRVSPLNNFPQELQYYLDKCHSFGDLTQQPGEMVFWSAVNMYASRYVQQRPDMTPQQRSYFNTNWQNAMAPLMPQPGKRKKRQTRIRPRTRREFRSMTVGQRRRYFVALNLLKQDNSLPPNVLDFIMAFHSGLNVRRAHFGPAFGPWHRLYLWILEYYLRMKVRGVSIPYWDSTLDGAMADPADSALFTPAFFGNGVGPLETGPFSTWAQINPLTRITRNYQGGPLFTNAQIARVLSRRRNLEIFRPTAAPQFDLEGLHGPVHVTVGGTMNDLNTAAFDPVFWSHHCFVDQIWEQFKDNQRSVGIDPQSDYPFIEGDPRFDPRHHPSATTGFADWTNEMGNINGFSRFVLYEERPSCNNRCHNSQYMRCVAGQCVPWSATELAGSNLLRELNLTNLNARQKRQVGQSANNYMSCPKRTFLNDVDLRQIGYTPMNAGQHQNSWAYIPVKIVSKRPTEYTHFNKYSLHSTGSKISPVGLNNAFMTTSVQKKYETCDKLQDTAGKIKIVGHGVNHKSYAEEYVVVDNRIGVSESIGYLPVKLPTSGVPTDVVVAAFDSCGRVCRPYCRQGMTNSLNSKFTGAVRVTSGQPLQYAHSYRDATLSIWDLPNETVCPSINYDNVPLSFFCEYSDTWIWGSGSSSPRPSVGPSPRHSVRPSPRPAIGPSLLTHPKANTGIHAPRTPFHTLQPDFEHPMMHIPRQGLTRAPRRNRGHPMHHGSSPRGILRPATSQQSYPRSRGGGRGRGASRRRAAFIFKH